MAKIFPQKMTAEMDGEFVVFIIGMRINKPWKVHKWLPVFLAMPRMLKELRGRPDSGLLGYWYPGPLTVIQYWRSFEHLEAFAHGRGYGHLPAERAFFRRGGFNGDVGIWHETYRVAPGMYEVVYGNMPAHGLGKVGRLMPAAGPRDTARQRMTAGAR